MSRNSGLDALRVIACLMVVLYHVATLEAPNLGPLTPFFLGADSGVYIFFALSGYLLYRPFARGHVDLRHYALNRAARILPGYVLAIAALTVLTGNDLALANPVPFLTITSGYFVPLRAFMGIAWTLAAEVMFYVTLPLIARIAHGRETAVLGGLGIASGIFALLPHLTSTDVLAAWANTYPGLVWAFVPGMLLATLEARRPHAFGALASSRFLFAGAVLIVIGMLTPASPIAFGASLGTPLLIGWLVHHQLPFGRELTFLGGMSYAVYLWHRDLLVAFDYVGLAIALVGATASWVILERPILSAAHRLRTTYLPVGRRNAPPVEEPVPAS